MGSISAVTSDLRLLFGQLHVVEDAEDDPEEVVPPVLLEGVAVALHDLEHDSEASVEKHNFDKLQLPPSCGRRSVRVFVPFHEAPQMLLWTNKTFQN